MIGILRKYLIHYIAFVVTLEFVTILLTGRVL